MVKMLEAHRRSVLTTGDVVWLDYSRTPSPKETPGTALPLNAPSTKQGGNRQRGGVDVEQELSSRTCPCNCKCSGARKGRESAEPRDDAATHEPAGEDMGNNDSDSDHSGSEGGVEESTTEMPTVDLESSAAELDPPDPP